MPRLHAIGDKSMASNLVSRLSDMCILAYLVV